MLHKCINSIKSRETFFALDCALEVCENMSSVIVNPGKSFNMFPAAFKRAFIMVGLEVNVCVATTSLLARLFTRNGERKRRTQGDIASEKGEQCTRESGI